MYFIHLAHYMLFLKSWTFHKCEAEREGTVGMFGFNRTIAVRQNVVGGEVIFLSTGKKRTVSRAHWAIFGCKGFRSE